MDNEVEYWKLKWVQAQTSLLYSKQPHMLGYLEFQEGNRLLNTARCTPKNGVIVEIGSYCGLSSAYLLTAAQFSGAWLHCVDPFQGYAASEIKDRGELLPILFELDRYPIFYHNMLRSFAYNYTKAGSELRNLIVHRGTSVETAEAWEYTEKGAKVDYLFIDGNHEQCWDDFEAWLPHLEPWAVVALHDVTFDGRYGKGGPDNVYQSLKLSGWTEVQTFNTLRILTRDVEFWQTRESAFSDSVDRFFVSGDTSWIREDRREPASTEDSGGCSSGTEADAIPDILEQPTEQEHEGTAGKEREEPSTGTPLQKG